MGYNNESREQTSMMTLKETTANPVLYRSYSRRKENGEREKWEEIINRTIEGLREEGNLNQTEVDLLYRKMEEQQALPPGRWLWVGGTEWIKQPENFYGAFNCTSININSWRSLDLMMEVAMEGCGTGAVLEPQYINQIPPNKNYINVEFIGELGEKYLNGEYKEDTSWLQVEEGTYKLIVGDSRRGWCDAYRKFLEASSDNSLPREVLIKVDLRYVRPKGKRLKGFGGTANPEQLPGLFTKCRDILNECRLNELSITKLIDEAARVVVAGNIRRTAGLRQYPETSPLYKENLWQQGEDGNWRIDPKREALRMANHTRIYHRKPTKDECREAVRKQYYSGEGAIQNAREAIARANVDILDTEEKKHNFLNSDNPESYLESLMDRPDKKELEHRMQRYGLNPCFTGDMRLLTSDGYRPFSELEDKDVEIINANGDKVTSKVWSNGERETICLWLSNNDYICCTPEHRLMTDEGEYPAQDCKGKRLIAHLGIHPPTVRTIKENGVREVFDFVEPLTHWGVVEGYHVHNCGEIIGSDFFCNLSEVHLNKIDPKNERDQKEAFQAAAITGAALLQRDFYHPEFQYSRELDPIIGVSFTGLFDFFVHAFGVDWLHWWQQGRPKTEQGKYFKQKEAEYLQKWKNIVNETISEYCDRHKLKKPNRFTTVQPAGTKSLLTGASPGWHPPKAKQFIRRITFRKNDPIAKACIDYGYTIVPAQGDLDEEGNLLNDPYDERCTEWLVEIPVAVSWANLPGTEGIDIERFSALAQFDFYMNIQQNWTGHNTSATIEFSEHEIGDLGNAIYDAIAHNKGYISAALLPRFNTKNSAFPRLPFEPLTYEHYQEMLQQTKKRRTTIDFHSALAYYDEGNLYEEGPAACDSDKCLY